MRLQTDGPEQAQQYSICQQLFPAQQDFGQYIERSCPEPARDGLQTGSGLRFGCGIIRYGAGRRRIIVHDGLHPCLQPAWQAEREMEKSGSETQNTAINIQQKIPGL